MKKAYKLAEIDNAVRFNEPIAATHPFFTDFNDVRGDFQDRLVYRALNVDSKNFTFDLSANANNKTLLFLAGMRGSGKTSELSKYALKLHHPDCFFCITCNIDKELDMNDVEYVDILIFQLEKLVSKVQEIDLKINTGTLSSLKKWFDEKVTEINSSIKGEASIETGVEAESPSFFSVLKIFAKLKAGVTGSKERSTTIRTTFKNSFSEFANKFNEFVGEVNLSLREHKKAREILFIVDGLEKTLSTELRRKIIMEENNRLQLIKANTIFTLPFELMKERMKISMFSSIISFPFVKLLNQDGTRVEAAFARFREFIFKRVDKSLFEDDAIIDRMIGYSGGSPRELLRIIELTNINADEQKEKLDAEALRKAIKKLAAQYANYLTDEMLEKLRQINMNNNKGKSTPFDNVIDKLLEDLLLLEYNDGSYKRVNPVVEESVIYKEYVGN